MMSRTLSQIAAQQSFMLWTTCAALVIFGLFFAAMVFWVSRKERAPLYEHMSLMPLATGSDHESSK
ncbi:MAG: cbb3-type cytochrome c oxidase subunit 3 [Bdellovibrionales bacterium]|nr:cbb3-type cytochrome c oxidase subunit 3 [Bdellovibrionales bacterium]